MTCDTIFGWQTATNKVLHRHYVEKLKSTPTHLLLSTTGMHPNDLLMMQLHNQLKSGSFSTHGDCGITDMKSQHSEPGLSTKCFTFTDCSERIRDPTGINRRQKKKPQSCGVWAKPRHQDCLHTCSVKRQRGLVQTKGKNCIQITILSYNREILNTIKSLSVGIDLQSYQRPYLQFVRTWRTATSAFRCWPSERTTVCQIFGIHFRCSFQLWDDKEENVSHCTAYQKCMFPY